MGALEYIEAEHARPFRWGETDCASTADRWFKILHGYSPMTRFGRHVMNEELGRAWLDQPGGVLRGMRDVMRCTDMPLLHTMPLSGDIGIIVVDNRACIAIFDGVLWRSRDEDGSIAAEDSHRFIAWEVACPRR